MFCSNVFREYDAYRVERLVSPTQINGAYFLRLDTFNT